MLLCTKCCSFSIGIAMYSPYHWTIGSDFLHRSESLFSKTVKHRQEVKLWSIVWYGKSFLALQIPSFVHVNDVKNVAQFGLWALIALICMWSAHYDICYDGWSGEWKNFTCFTVSDGECWWRWIIQCLFILRNMFQLIKAMDDVHHRIVQWTIFKFIGIKRMTFCLKKMRRKKTFEWEKRWK